MSDLHVISLHTVTWSSRLHPHECSYHATETGAAEERSGSP